MGDCALITPVYLEIALMSGARSGARATGQAISAIDIAGISIRALREEGDESWRRKRCRPSDFYPRPPARRATSPVPCSCWLRRYFYPRPPRGGRQRLQSIIDSENIFLSTPSAKRATLELLRGLLRFKLFLSTPSVRRVTDRFY